MDLIYLLPIDFLMSAASQKRAFKELGKVRFWSTLGHAESY